MVADREHGNGRHIEGRTHALSVAAPLGPHNGAYTPMAQGGRHPARAGYRCSAAR